MRFSLFSTVVGCLLFFSCQHQNTQAVATDAALWPELTQTAKPWTRWWWMGSAVDKPNIKEHLIAFEKAGLGGVEITPIYGAKGEEEQFLEFLSPEYLELLDYTITTADSLGLGVDMVLGTGFSNVAKYCFTNAFLGRLGHRRAPDWPPTGP